MSSDPYCYITQLQKKILSYYLLRHPLHTVKQLQTLLIDDRNTDNQKHCINEKDSALIYSCLQSDVLIRLITVHHLSMIMNDSLLITAEISESSS